MSYNIDSWKTKRLENFTVPTEAFMVDGFDVRMKGTDTVRITGYSEMFEIKGHLVSENVVFDEIRNGGEGSGHFHDTLLGVMKKSTGYLEAVLVWERGNSISRLIVNNGVVTEEDIEL